MIPDGWTECGLDQLSSAPISYGVVKPGDHDPEGVAFIRGGDFPNGRLDPNKLRTITRLVSDQYKRTRLKGGEILISLVGYPGACVVVPPELAGANIARQAAVIRPKKGVSTDFLFQFIRSPVGQARLLEKTIGSAQQVINLKDLREVIIPSPPLPEQRRIAEILATWDRAIETVEALIANARAQKKALMQSLLTGKKRLSGFSGAWREIRLREIGHCYNGVTYSPDDVTDESGLLVLRSSNVQKGRLAFADNVYVNPSTKVSCLTVEGDILICVRNGSRNLIGKTAKITPDAVGHAHGAFMSLFRSTEPKFAYHLFQSDAYEQQVNLNLGATINSINTSDLNKFKFLLPPKDERDRIAQVLADADGEIEILETQLTALRQEKSALMQQLLTGKRRVRSTEKEAA